MNTTDTMDNLSTSQLAEFETLRKEIEFRSSAQLTLISLNLTGIGTLVGFALTQLADPRLLILVPIIAPCIGMLYLDHAIMISMIGSYIEHSFKYNWEKAVRQQERQTAIRFLLFGIPILLMFSAIPIASLIFTYSILADVWMWTLWITGGFMTGAFLFFWLRFLFQPFIQMRTRKAQTS